MQDSQINLYEPVGNGMLTLIFLPVFLIFVSSGAMFALVLALL